MGRPVVLSIPHSGTTFTMYLLCKVIGADAKFLHFQPGNFRQIQKYMKERPYDSYIIPWRDPVAVVKTWLGRLGDRRDLYEILNELEGCYRCRDAILEQANLLGVEPINFCVARSKVNLEEVRTILRKCGQPWSLALSKFLKDWPRIGRRAHDVDVASLVRQLGEKAGTQEFKTIIRRYTGDYHPVFDRRWCPEVEIPYDDPELRRIMTEQVLR